LNGESTAFRASARRHGNTLNGMFAEHLKDKPASWVGCEKTQKAEIST
jgi:hypothetical protein